MYKVAERGAFATEINVIGDRTSTQTREDKAINGRASFLESVLDPKLDTLRGEAMQPY
jgi:hypothetical protein